MFKNPQVFKSKTEYLLKLHINYTVAQMSINNNFHIQYPAEPLYTLYTI